MRVRTPTPPQRLRDGVDSMRSHLANVARVVETRAVVEELRVLVPAHSVAPFSRCLHDERLGRLHLAELRDPAEERLLRQLTPGELARELEVQERIADDRRLRFLVACRIAVAEGLAGVLQDLLTAL